MTTMIYVVKNMNERLLNESWELSFWSEDNEAGRQQNFLQDQSSEVPYAWRKACVL